MTRSRQQRTAFPGHKSFFADESALNRDVEQSALAVPGEVESSISVAIGEQPRHLKLQILIQTVRTHRSVSGRLDTEVGLKSHTKMDIRLAK